MEKKGKIVLATITVAGYVGKTKVTKQASWRIMMVDEKNPDQLIEQQRQYILSQLGTEKPEDAFAWKVKVSKVETHTFDTYVSSEEKRIRKRNS